MVRLFLLFLGLFVLAPAWAKGPSLDVVFDLDWTLFYPSKTSTGAEEILIGSDYYRMTDGVAQVIVALHRDGHRVSLFSGGDQERNQALAQFLIEKIQAQGVSDFSFFKILNKNDLSRRPGTSSDARFGERFMKDISKVNKDLSRVVIVDDMASFSAPGQEKNMYYLGKTYMFSDVYNPLAYDAYNPPNEEEWRRERRKILSFCDHFKAAVADSLGVGALAKLQALKNGQPLCSKVFSN